TSTWPQRFCVRSSMPPVLAYARVPEDDLLAAYDEQCGRLGLISVNLGSAARTFLRRWPDPQRWAGEPLETRLTVSHPTRSFATFLMLAGYLRPGYDYLIRRKLAVFWRHLPPGPLAEDLAGSWAPRKNSASPNAGAARPHR